ncbi:hypothetical protein EU524_00175 [Candidatus Thorarchaeota archaeon]|jgi:hypothetical protein|nr:MAG: hypothetical protein EU524_00175 [Candidatus Thorarchaeota archaeon]
MMEEQPYQSRATKRDNNLAGYAIVCFIICAPLIQLPLLFLPFMSVFPGGASSGFIIMLAIGIVFAIAGVYFLVKWFNSGS